MRTEYLLFVHQNTSILAKLSTWCFEHSGDISCSLLVNPSHNDESWEGLNMCLWIYIVYIYIYMYIYIYIYIYYMYIYMMWHQSLSCDVQYIHVFEKNKSNFTFMSSRQSL